MVTKPISGQLYRFGNPNFLEFFNSGRSCEFGVRIKIGLHSCKQKCSNFFLTSCKKENIKTSNLQDCVKELRPTSYLKDTDKHHQLDLKIESLSSDTSFYFTLQEGQWDGISDTYVDALLRAGDTWIKKVSSATKKRFDMKPSTPLPIYFTGCYLHFHKDHLVQQSKLHYVHKLEYLDQDVSFTSLRSIRMHLAWNSHTKPYCAIWNFNTCVFVPETEYPNSNVAMQCKKLTYVRYFDQNEFPPPR